MACHTPSLDVEISRHRQGVWAQLSEEVVIELSRQHRCGPGLWRHAITAPVPPSSLPEPCREISTVVGAAPGLGRPTSHASVNPPRQRRVLRCVVSSAGLERHRPASAELSSSHTACTISGTQCFPWLPGAADQPERLPWILPRIRSSSLAPLADLRRPMRRPRSCDCSTRRLRFRPMLGWCWRGGGW